MKRTALPNRHVGALDAELGHLDEVVVADAGLQVPPERRLIDLVVSPGLPSLLHLLTLLKSELFIEGAVHATECTGEPAQQTKQERNKWEAEQSKTIEVTAVLHAGFKDRTKAARAVIRSGGFTSSASLNLISGVPF